MSLAQLQRQFAYYQEKMKDEERVRSIYHDLKNHLLVMESRQNTEETRQMAETLRSQIADYEDYVHTGNEFLDIILKDKAAKAREKQIDFSAISGESIRYFNPISQRNFHNLAGFNSTVKGHKYICSGIVFMRPKRTSFFCDAKIDQSYFHAFSPPVRPG